MKKTNAFTLIELLIVVAIIAILAAIAVPNFLEAQTRSKVSRMQAELRTVATSLEAYMVDNRKYPKYGNPLDKPLPSDVMTFVPVGLTTPIAYLSSVPDDIFLNKNPDSDVGLGVVTPARYFHNYQEFYILPNGLARRLPAGHVQEHYEKIYGQKDAPVMWQLFSRGPDHLENHGLEIYDPTNGTLSRGDVIRFGP